MSSALRNTRIQVQEGILRNHRDNIVSCFERYRNFTAHNESFRSRFFQILKQEILLSLNHHELGDLLRDLQINLYSNQNNHSVTNEIQPDNMTAGSYYSNHDRSSNSTGDTDFEYLENHDYQQSTVQYNNNYYVNKTHPVNAEMPMSGYFYHQYGYPDIIIPRSNPNKSSQSELSKHIKYDDDLNYLPLSDADEEISKEKKFRNCLIKEEFNKLSDIIRKNGDILQGMENLKTQHGFNLYREVISHIPIEEESLIREPIMFQLALKFKYGQAALDKLMEDGLFLLNQKNQHHLTVYNVVLFKDFNIFCQFVSHIQLRKVNHNIKYIQIEEDYIVHSYSNMHRTKLEKDLQASTIKKVSLKKEEVSDLQIVEKLEKLDINKEKSVKSQKYMQTLVDQYPDSMPEIDLILKQNDTYVLNSHFFVLLAQRDIILFHNFLRSLVKNYKIDRRDLCKICREKHEYITVERIIDRNKKMEFECSSQKIKEFINKYKEEI